MYDLHLRSELWIRIIHVTDKQFFRIPHLCCDWFWKPACQLSIVQHNSVTPQRAIPECGDPYSTIDSSTVSYSHVGGIILESRIMGIFSYSRNVNKNYTFGILFAAFQRLTVRISNDASL